MRIHNIAAVKHLSKKVKKQLINEFNNLPKKETVIRHHKNKIQKDPKTNRPYCIVPSTDPAVKLYKLLSESFGDLCNGGELVTEMIMCAEKTKWRIDFALPLFGLAIEFDGFGYHRSLTAFKRDREKQKHILKEGWVLLRLTNQDVRKYSHLIIDDIKKIISHRPRFDYRIKPVGLVWCKLEHCHSV